MNKLEKSDTVDLDELRSRTKTNDEQSVMSGESKMCEDGSGVEMSPIHERDSVTKYSAEIEVDTKATRGVGFVRTAADRIIGFARGAKTKRKSLENRDATINELQKTINQLEKTVETLTEKNSATAVEKKKLRRILYAVLVILLVLIVSQFAISNSVVKKYTSTKVNSNGVLITTSSSESGEGISVSTRNSDMSVSDDVLTGSTSSCALTSREGSVVGTYQILFKKQLSSAMLDSAFQKLRTVSFDISENVSSHYTILGYHRTLGEGAYGSTVTLKTTDGAVFLDGYKVTVDGNMSDSLARACPPYETDMTPLFGLPRRILPNSTLVLGEFNTNNDLDLYQHVEALPRPTFFQNFRINLTSYRLCDIEPWQLEWCANATDVVTHDDFPGRFWYLSYEQWSFSEDGLFRQQVSFNSSLSSQIQYSSTSVRSGVSIQFLSEPREVMESYTTRVPFNCYDTYNASFGPNIIHQLSEESYTYQGDSFFVNGQQVRKFDFKFYDANYDTYDIVEWYEDSETGELLRIIGPAIVNITGRSFGEQNYMVNSFSDVDGFIEANTSQPSDWWSYATSDELTCPSVCSVFLTCRQTAVYYPRPPNDNSTGNEGTVPAATNFTSARRKLSSADHKAEYRRWLKEDSESWYMRRLAYEMEHGNMSFYYTSHDDRKALGCYQYTWPPANNAWSWWMSLLPFPEFILMFNCPDYDNGIGDFYFRLNVENSGDLRHYVLGGLIPLTATFNGGGEVSLYIYEPIRTWGAVEIKIQAEVPESISEKCKRKGSFSVCVMGKCASFSFCDTILELPAWYTRAKTGYGKAFPKKDSGFSKFYANYIFFENAVEYQLGPLYLDFTLPITFFDNHVANVQAVFNFRLAKFGYEWKEKIVVLDEWANIEL